MPGREEDYERYKVEPYVIPGDVYSLEDHVGRGGWTWYTGAASWIYRVWLEEVIGFKRRGEKLRVDPVIPADWPSFRVKYRYRGSFYDITVDNPEHVSQGVVSVEVDGASVEEKVIALRDDGQPHTVLVRLGPKD